MTVQSRPASKPLPLDGLLVLDLSQFLAGPFAALRLADMGARVIKVERPGAGDLSRTLYLTDVNIDGDSTPYHTINRNKESVGLDLKAEDDRALLRRMIARADVLIQNFRPGVIERLGFGYDAVRAINPRMVYASISGYGRQGPWVELPGQDLLAQARSGLMWLSGDTDHPPIPVGVSIADMLASAACTQGVLAALVGRANNGHGAHVETSLLDVLTDVQSEFLTTYMNDGGRSPKRAGSHGASAYLPAPYGVYRTGDGHIAIAMTPIGKLAELLDDAGLAAHAERPDTWFVGRDVIATDLARILARETTDHWIALFQPADIWCAPVLDWPTLLASDAFAATDMVQTVERRGPSGVVAGCAHGRRA
jgi:crotonobetainyl-CoA:carnitine CoA-transferase CaiB-like acyl-CoA transferase